MTSFYTYAILFFCLLHQMVSASTGNIHGVVTDSRGAIEFATVGIQSINRGTVTNGNGYFELAEIPSGTYVVSASFVGYEVALQKIEVRNGQTTIVNFALSESSMSLNEVVVVSGTLKEVNRLESPVPVEVYTPIFFQRNPTPNMFEALQNVNGVRPQLNCNVCNTGDIHINGLEGPYTMVLIDGMPIVSSLATVYGLSGIPNSLIERMEVAKGPASSLYGSEAIGGLINIITKNPQNAPRVSADVMTTTWQEHNTDLGIKLKAGKKADVLTGLNYYHYNHPVDNNNDNFTDVTLQQRISIFQKYNFTREKNRLFTVAGRYFYEDRWGGEMQWNESYRGGTEVYGESIYTKRWEMVATYQLPTTEHILLSTSINHHDQNSVYGNTPYLATQNIGFGQLYWDKGIGKHNLLAGAAIRYTYYDDNTAATGGDRNSPTNTPDEVLLPGIFLQDEYEITNQHAILGGIRYDNHPKHGNILTPRLAYKWKITDNDLIRINAGTGFRVVNLFAEDHAALTGAREVVFDPELKPEQSYNINLNYIKKIFFGRASMILIDASAWHTYFTNIILPDYDTNPNQIIYDNLNGSATSKGISLNADLSLSSEWAAMLGATLMDVSSEENGQERRQTLTERFSGTWSVSYSPKNSNIRIDYTGNVYGSMLLPLLGDLDPRQPRSPTWSIQNVQISYTGIKDLEFYGGVKNLLNWTPDKGNPFLIARAHDPFDEGVATDSSGGIIATEENPYALTFDPSYVYAPNQGIRGFVGIRYTMP